MKRLGSAIIAAALGLLLAGGAADAAIIFDNGTPEYGGGSATTWVRADDFTLDTGATIAGGGLYFSGTFHIVPWDGTLDYFLFADNAGAPGDLLASGSGQNVVKSDTGIPWGSGHNIFLLEFDLEELFVAAAGTTYWLGIHLAEDFDLADAGAGFWVKTPAVAGNPAHYSRNGTFDNWGVPPQPQDLAFYLTSPERVSVPEPSVLALLGTGLLGLGLVRARRRA